MEMNRKNIHRISTIAALIIASLLITFLIWRLKKNELIGQEQAFQYAIQACNPSYGLKQVEQPTEFQAELTTYKKAVGFVPNPFYANRPVWVIRMKGRWLLVGGPLPDPTSNPEPVYWEECIQIIDAETGESLSYPIE
jgi:hypothetical protein